MRSVEGEVSLWYSRTFLVLSAAFAVVAITLGDSGVWAVILPLYAALSFTPLAVAYGGVRAKADTAPFQQAVMGKPFSVDCSKPKLTVTGVPFLCRKTSRTAPSAEL